MFLYIGLVCATLFCTAYAGDNPEVTPAANETSSSESVSTPEQVTTQEGGNVYFTNLSQKSVSLLKRLARDVSPELAAVCHEESGNLTSCKKLLGNLANRYYSSSKIDCEIILELNPRNDPFDIRSTCKKVEPTCKKWQADWKAAKKDQKAQAAQSNENKQ